MNKRISIITDPHSENVDLFKKKAIVIKSGITVLVGCNGSGKTTLLKQIKENIKKRKEFIISFDNLKQGGQRSLEEQMGKGNFGFVAKYVQYSEGENIMLNMSNIITTLGDLVRNKKLNNKKELWLLFDAVDSGLSIDNIVDLKTVFDIIMTDKRLKDKSIFIILTANSYEVARGERCYDVSNCKYINIKSYEEYRNIILESAKIKQERYEKITELEKIKNKRSLDFERHKNE